MVDCEPLFSLFCSLAQKMHLYYQVLQLDKSKNKGQQKQHEVRVLCVCGPYLQHKDAKIGIYCTMNGPSVGSRHLINPSF